ncbi:MAG: acetolactate synthase small subunit [Candidatus Delongbacteria bacterium]|nr:acetolactate synthase small subunit [Candidatus Delongbacteria bacterium]
MTKHTTLDNTHIVSVLVWNKPGVLMRITALIKRRGFNIESISAGKWVDERMTRIIIVVLGDERILEQVERQLYKVVDTVSVSLIHPVNNVEREMALIKVKPSTLTNAEVIQIVEIFRGKIVDANQEGFIVEITGHVGKIDAFINLLGNDNVKDISRTGFIAMDRWAVKSGRKG